MITETMINEWREENEKGNGIGAGDNTRVLDADEAVEIIKEDYPSFEIIATEEMDGARVLCKDGTRHILFMDANGMWGQEVSADA